MSNKIKIVVTGGTGRFAKILKKYGKKYKYIYPLKKELNILNRNLIKKFLKKSKPKYLLHLAGLSRPINIHKNQIQKSFNKCFFNYCFFNALSSLKQMHFTFKW